MWVYILTASALDRLSAVYSPELYFSRIVRWTETQVSSKQYK